MKKLVGILLVLSLLAPLSATAFAEVEDPGGGVWHTEFSGYTLVIPEAYRTASGFIHYFDFGGGLEYEGTGVMYSCVYYSGMTKDERLDALDEIDMAFLMEEWDLVGTLEMELEKKQLDLFAIYVTGNPWGTEELRAFLKEKAVKGAQDRRDDAETDFYARAYETASVSEIGEKDGFHYFLVSFTPEILREESGGNIEESYLEEGLSLLSQPELITENLTMTTPMDEAAISYRPADDDVHIEVLF